MSSTFNKDWYSDKAKIIKQDENFMITLAWCGSAHRNENGESPVELPKPSDCFGNTQ